MTRYLSGLFACALGLCTGGWLVVTAALLRAAPSAATLVSLGTGAGVALVSVIGIACWSVAWRQRMRIDGVLIDRDRPPSAGQARRNRRALRRDMRRVARFARAGQRHDYRPLIPGQRLPGQRRPGQQQPVQRLPGQWLPGQWRPAAAETATGPTAGRTAPGQAGGADSPAVALTELRAILEPLLTTGPLEVVPAAQPQVGPGPVIPVPRSPARLAEDGEESW